MPELVRYLHRRPRPRWRRWVDRLDPWSPRPVDYVIAAGVCLALALAYIAERSYAVEQTRRIFRLEERLGSLGEEGDALAARATALADRSRIVSLAQRELGMVVPGPEAFAYIYYVPDEAGGSRRTRWVGGASAPGRTETPRPGAPRR
jgi:cell division protein FtsL